MKYIMHATTLALGLFVGNAALAEIKWLNYDEAAVAQAQTDGKSVILGFHKEGCGTCESQSQALESNGVASSEKVMAFRVERQDEKLDKVYERYGFNKKQWAALVLLKNGREFARISPFQTSPVLLQNFSQQVN